jgi:hypothetical protein
MKKHFSVLPILAFLTLFIFVTFYIVSNLMSDSRQDENDSSTETYPNIQVFKLRSIENGDLANSYVLTGYPLEVPGEREGGLFFKLSTVGSNGSRGEQTDQTNFLIFLGENNDLIDTTERQVGENFVNYVTRPVSEVVESIDFNLPVEIRLNTKLSEELIKNCSGDSCEAFFQKTKSNEVNEPLLEEIIENSVVLNGDYIFYVYYVSNIH